MAQWVRLEESSDWGYRFLRLKNPTKAYAYADRRTQEVGFGRAVLVKWPNDVITQEALVWTTYSESVSDHGHSYTVDFALPAVSVAVEHNGYIFRHKIPLTEFLLDSSYLTIPKS
ncbi:MAG: hypothetical protein E6R03_14975 [Hyphomicrobiaceae bacterium]|nr:MAG: hypothetical protein E6R03_14975 [Hyphomicrobiaceae bacterium]